MNIQLENTQIRCAPKEATILQGMIDAYPMAYATRYVPISYGAIKVYVCNLRKLLGNTGYQILNERSVGYRLVKEPT